MVSPRGTVTEKSMKGASDVLILCVLIWILKLVKIHQAIYL